MYDNDGVSQAGAVYILCLNKNGTVKTQYKISNLTNGFNNVLTSTSWFGSIIDSMGDFDNDGVQDIIVGAYGKNTYTGTSYLICLNVNGTVKSYKEIGPGVANFNDTLATYSRFGNATCVGDLDGDGIIDVAIGGGQKVGVFFLNIDGSIKKSSIIGQNMGGLNVTFPSNS